MTTEPTLSHPIDHVSQRVRAVIAEQLGRPVEEVPPDATFFDLGADSLLLVGITRQLDRELGVRIAMRELFGQADTPTRLADLIAAKSPPGPAPSPPAQPVRSEPPHSPQADPPVRRAEPRNAHPRVEPQAPRIARITPAESSTIEPVPAEAGPAAAQTRLLAGFADLVAERTVGAEPDVAAAQVRLVAGLAELMAGQLGQPTDGTVTLNSTSDDLAVTAAPERPQTVATPTAPSSPDVDIASVRDVVPAPGSPDFSVYFFGDYPRDSTNGTDKYNFIVDATKFADRNGFHAAWLPERHFHSFGGLFPNPSVLAAALARETDQIRLHAGSVVLPLHQTIRVAEEWSVVDNLSGGRAGICIASGWHANDFALFPQRYGNHRESMYEQLTELRALWRGESIPAVSGTGDDIDLQLYPTPVQDMPPMYAAVVGNPESYRLAARNGLGIVTNLMTQSIEQLAERIALYRRERADCGLDPDTGRVVVLVHTFLGSDFDTVRRQAFAPFCDYMRSSLGLLGQAANSLGMTIDVHNTPEDDLRFLLEQAYDRYCESRALIGTVDSTSAIVADLVAAGANEIAAFLDFGMPADTARTGLTHLASLRDRFTHDSAETDTAADSTAPLSFSQERFWLAEQLFPEHTTYNEARAVRLRGHVDSDVLRTAFEQLADRHPTLRTVIRDTDGQPRQVVVDGLPVDFSVTDHVGADEDDLVGEIMAEESAHRFRLADGPLCRFRLLRLGPEHHVLFINAHHAIIDTVSAYRLAAEISQLYRAQQFQATPKVPELPIGYLDYARSQREPDPNREIDLAYWREQLAGELPVLSLPTDRPRPTVLSPTGASIVEYLDADISQRIRQFSGEQRSTMFMTLLTGLAATLRRLSGQSEVIIGTAIADRPDGTENLIGAMLNTIPLRIAQSHESFTQLLRTVRDTAMDGYQHSAAPFELIVDAVAPPRDTSRTPLFQTLVVFENEDVFDLDLPGVEATLLDAVPDRAIYDIAFYLANHPDGVRVHVEYNTQLFDESTIIRYVRQFESLMDVALAEPDRAIESLADLPATEAAQLDRWQVGPDPQPYTQSLVDRVSRIVEARPTATAVESDTTMTYAELDHAAGELAAALQAVGDRPVVAVRLPRGPGLVTAHLAVLRSGGICLPIDPSLPAERVRFMLTDTGCRVMLTDTDDDLPVTTWRLDATGRLDTADRPVPPAGPDSPDPGQDAAYLIYTSGSTGKPKGVPVDHRGIDNACAWYRSRTRLAAGTRTTVTAGTGFDVFIMELWSALTAGAQLVMPSEEARHEPSAMIAWLIEHDIEVAWLPTVLAEGVITDAESDRLPTRIIVTVGSALRAAPRAGAPFELVNAYGPAEASIVVSHATIPAGAETIPIGAPLPGTELVLFDERSRRVPIGVTGEIHIGGVGVASGYLGRPELTAERFVTIGSKRYYASGDLARWNRHGQLEFLGRNDDQVKIRGFRVEPGEVATALRNLDDITDAVVITESDPPRLVAYLVCPRPVEISSLRDRLRRVLPQHMVPHRFEFISKLPLNPNGKVDRSRLPQTEASSVLGERPRTETEEHIARLWQTELGYEVNDVEASFFDLGGDSLAAARLVSRVRSSFEVAYPLLDFFRAPTIRDMVEKVSDGTPSPVLPSVADGRVRGTI